MIVTCEHGGNDVPKKYSHLFVSAGAKADLVSHRGYDPGALVAANFIAKHFHVELVSSTVTRLLVDLNRSEGNLGLLSKYSSSLDVNGREQLLDRYYRPYRTRVRDRVAQEITSGKPAVHLSVHTFTRKYRGDRRDMDIGILFDPQRGRESELARSWCAELSRRMPHSRVRENEPYLGTDDGLTTWLRTQFDEDHYIGIELEIANSFAKQSAIGQRRRLETIAQTLALSALAASGDF